MAGLKSEDAKVQVNNPDGSGSWNVLDVNFDASVNISPELLDDVTFGDDAEAKIKGLIGASIELTFRTESSPDAAVEDLRDAALDNNARNEEVQVEFSPDGEAPGGPTEVIAFTVMLSEYSLSASSGDSQERSVSGEISDGQKPEIKGSFSS